MKGVVFVLLLLQSFSLSAQAVDSTQYNMGYKIGENIPVVLLMAVGLFFIIRGFRKKGAEPNKTDFMDDGTESH